MMHFNTHKYFYIRTLIIICISATSSSLPNILMVVVDDLRPALGCYGDKNAYTPNIDKLAGKSFIFTNAFVQQAVCAPSRNSFLTSRRPDTLHLYDFFNYWRTFTGNFTTIPQFFKENGYNTQSIGKVFHPGITSNFTDDYPLSWSNEAIHPKSFIYENTNLCLNDRGKLVKNLNCPVIVEEQPLEVLPDQETVSKAKLLLQSKIFNEKKPYFLAVGLHKPHVPFRFPREFLNYHPIENIVPPSNTQRPSLMPVVAWNPWTDVRRRQDVMDLNISFPFGEMPNLMTKKIIQNYAASTTYMDSLVGDLLEDVDNNTIILLFGDHGWSLGEHGEFAKYSNFDVATKVPLLIHVPWLTNQKRKYIDELVELVDIFPTLVDLTKVTNKLNTCPKETVNLCTEGRSLIPLMMNDHAFWKTATFSQYPRPGLYPTSKPNSDKPHLKEIKIMGYSIRTKRYRYTEWVEFNHTSFNPNWSRVYARELYDHLIDPNENQNLASNYLLSGVVRNLRKKLILGWRYA